jgi:hypothetical protein
MAHGVGVGSFGGGRGLALLLNDDINVKLQSFDKLHIMLLFLICSHKLQSSASQVSIARQGGSFALDVGIGCDVSTIRVISRGCARGFR